MQRLLYLAAYDVHSPRRLRKALYILKDYACGGQKSVFECYLTHAERKELMNRIEEVLDSDQDAFIIVRMISRDAVSILGAAIKPADELYSYVG